jgi:MFS family permease
MTSTPLAMVGHGFSPQHAADVVRWHVFAMFAPSFFTGVLIARFGVERVIAAGLMLLGVCAAIALSGVEIHRFYLALILLGVGWNFSFVGATSLLATAHSVEERAKVQGFNDFLVFGLVSVASFSSGALLNSSGWSAVQIAALPGIVVGLLALAWIGIRSRYR